MFTSVAKGANKMRASKADHTLLAAQWQLQRVIEGQPLQSPHFLLDSVFREELFHFVTIICCDGMEESLSNSAARRTKFVIGTSSGFPRQVLRPGLVKGPWTQEEDSVIVTCIQAGMTKWSEIAERIPCVIGQRDPLDDPFAFLTRALSPFSFLFCSQRPNRKTMPGTLLQPPRSVHQKVTLDGGGGPDPGASPAGSGQSLV